MCNFLQISQFHEEYPEQTQDKPWERIREIINEKSVREALRSCQTPEEARALLLA